jgi:hypothetical protein
VKSIVRSYDSIRRSKTILTDKAGVPIAADKNRLYEIPFILGTNTPSAQVPLAVASGGVGGDNQGVAEMRVSGEGPVQVTQLTAYRNVATNKECLVQLLIRDGTEQYAIMNAPVHIDTIFGSRGEAYPLPEALYIDENRTLSASFYDLTGTPTTNYARISAQAGKYTRLRDDPKRAVVEKRLQRDQMIAVPYFYTFDSSKVVLTALQALNRDVSISPIHNFEIHQLSAVSTGTFSMDIVDVAKGESIINAPQNTSYKLPDTLMFGDNQHPFRFHEPIMTFGGQRLQISIQDTSGSANTVYITLAGRAIKVRQWS